MGRLQDKNTLLVNPGNAIITKAISGWTWYCGYHDLAGVGCDFDEAQFMAGCHLYYWENVNNNIDVCELHYREHKTKEEP